MKTPFLRTLSLLAVTLMASACSESGGGVTVAPESSSSEADNSSASVATRDFSRAALINAKLGRGINMGNSLESDNAEGNWGWAIEERFFTYIKAAGFNSVRIPVRWSGLGDPGNTGDLSPEFLARVQEVVGQANGKGLLAIINMHHFNELTGVNGAGLDFEEQQDRFVQYWEQIAQAFQGVSNDSLVFELLNEPGDRVNAAVHNALLARAIPVIRESNPNRTLMVGLTSYGQWPGAKSLVIPAEESNIIMTVHHYDPFQFTHQGANWTAYGDVTGVTWGTSLEKAAIAERFQDMADGAQKYFPSTDGKGIPINVGEFGAYSAADMTSRANWTSAIVKNCLQFGFSSHYWEFNSGFGAYDMDNQDWNKPLLDALMTK